MHFIYKLTFFNDQKRPIQSIRPQCIINPSYIFSMTLISGYLALESSIPFYYQRLRFANVLSIKPKIAHSENDMPYSFYKHLSNLNFNVNLDPPTHICQLTLNFAISSWLIENKSNFLINFRIIIYQVKFNYSLRTSFHPRWNTIDVSS